MFMTLCRRANSAKECQQPRYPRWKWWSGGKIDPACEKSQRAKADAVDCLRAVRPRPDLQRCASLMERHGDAKLTDLLQQTLANARRRVQPVSQVRAALPLAAARDGVSALQGRRRLEAGQPPARPPASRQWCPAPWRMARGTTRALSHHTGAHRAPEARASRNRRAAAWRRQASQMGGGGWGRGYEPTSHCLALASCDRRRGMRLGAIRAEGTTALSALHTFPRLHPTASAISVAPIPSLRRATIRARSNVAGRPL
jgi:hypothetical protein